MTTLHLFDAYCALGPLTAPVFGQEFTTADELLTAMAATGVAEALVYSPVAYEYDPAEGNARLMELITGHDNLHPCWVLLPPATREMPPPDALISEMRAAGVRAARLCPSPARNNFSLGDWCSGSLLRALAEAHIPTFIDLSEISWDGLASLLSRYPQLPVVLTGVTYRIDRYLYALWEQFDMLRIDISGYQGLHAVESAVARFGAERLLFGSNAPLYGAGAAVTTVAYAAISPEEKALIAGGNLYQLLEAAHGA